MLLLVALFSGLPSSSAAPEKAAEALLEVDTASTGQISSWQLMGKQFAGPALPLLEVGLLPADADLRQPVGQPAVGRFKIDPRSVRSNGGELHLEGAVIVDESPVIRAICRYQLSSPEKPTVVLRLEALDGLKRYKIQNLNWQLPLGLKHRKRIYYPGENGLSWETRYFYQFHTDTLGRLLSYPDRNEWQYFSLDQLAPEAFTLWRSESATTSPLVMQHGRKAPPFCQVYDEQGGVLVEYKELQRLAPKSLQVFAAEGGAVGVSLWPASEPPLDLRDKVAAGKVFGVDHHLNLHAFLGQNEVVEVRSRFLPGENDTARPDPAEVFNEEKWVRETSLPGSSPMLVTGGYPFPRGQVKDAGAIMVAAGGKALPVQSKAIGFWPDGSVKWALLSFFADSKALVSQGAEAAQARGPVVTCRDGRVLPLEMELRSGGGVREEIAETGSGAALSLEENKDGVTIDTGALRVGLQKGTRWLRSIQLGGEEILDLARADRLAYADYLLNPERVAPHHTLAEGGTLSAGVLDVKKLAIEERGPLRCVVRLEGMTSGAEPVNVVMRLEATAGSPALKVTHSIEILSKDPRKAFIRSLGLEIPLKMGWPTVHFGGEKSIAVPDEVLRSGLYQRIPEYYEVKGSTETGGAPLGAGAQSRGWVKLSDEKAGLIAVIRNLWQQSPKALVVDHEKPSVRIEFWPEEGPLMDMRRYSNHTHRSQGEGISGAASKDWVTESYYRRDPVAGLSRTHEVLLHFYKGPSPDAEIVAADFQSPPLLYAGWKRYLESGVVLPSAEQWDRYWGNAERFSAFWLWHRKLDHWFGFWNFGDIRHLFGTGYGWIFPPDVLRQRLEETKRGIPPVRDRRNSILDYAPANDWAFDNGRWGWANTEGLPNLFFQQEYLRTGNRALYFLAESMAHRSRDVVVRQSGHWFGLGTRHGVQPWSDGNHEERQTVNTEYKLHYFLSGDGRTRDVVNKLYEGVYSKRDVSIHAAHSGRLYGLLTHWEMTGDWAEAEQFRKYVACFLSPDGLFIQPAVSFPGPVSSGEATGLNDNNMFFHTFGGMHALLEYYYLTKDEELRQALIKMADYAIGNRRKGEISSNYWGVIAFAIRHGENPDRFRQALLQSLAANWQLVYQTVGTDPKFWSGENSFLTSNAPRSFFWVTIAPYVLGAFPGDVLWNEEIAGAMKEIEAQGIPRQKTATALSWQSEYDGIPELDDYLAIDRPWEPVKKRASVQKSERKR